MKSFSTILSIVRIMLTPCIVGLLLIGDMYIFLVPLVFSLAAVTDYFDGHYARKFNVVSQSGSFLDAFADKILILSLFYTFYYLTVIPLWVVVCIVTREVFLMSLRLFMLYMGTPLQTMYIGKIKTVIQMIAVYLILGFLCFDIFSGYDTSIFSTYASIRSGAIMYTMYSVVFITFYSGVVYLIKNRMILLSIKKWI